MLPPLRQKPQFSYCGLTIIMSNPSRLDLKCNTLLSANGGCFFNEQCLAPDFNIYQCDVRLKECQEPFLPNTKCVLLLGEEAAQQILDKDNTLNEIRGSVYLKHEIPHIASYFPQDAVDIKNYEQSHNVLHSESNGHDEDDDGDESDGNSEKRRHGRTKRKNYGFWLRKDTQKAKDIIKKYSGRIPEASIKPNYIIAPSSQHIISELERHKDEIFFFDMETDGPLNMLCFSFSFGTESNVFVVPCLDYDYSWFYDNLHCIYRSLAVCLSNNTFVAHNGSNFDAFVLAYKYRLSVKRCADTMLMHHRCFPEVEKSLGHGMSLWTYEPFHKDEGGGGYMNHDQAKRLWAYCGKDTYGMKLMYYAMLDYAGRHPGLLDSFEQVNASIVPYLTVTMQGIRYLEEQRKETMAENDQLMMQYLRCIRLLVGEKSTNELSKRFKSALPSSNPHCCAYFHDMLSYPVVGRGKIKKDGTRAPSLAKKNMFKLKLKYNNPVIDFSIAYRELAKESGSLKFTAWKESN